MRYETRTKLTPAQVMQHAKEFFGMGGLGLAIQQQASDFGMWKGGGGTMSVRAVRGQGDKDTTVELVTSQWDEAVHHFIERIGGHA